MTAAGFRWLTPAAPAALAVVELPALAVLDRPLPDAGRARFARLRTPAGAVVDEVVATRRADRRLELSCHGGAGVRAAVTACLAAWGLAEDGPAARDRWGALAAAAHPAAAAWLLAHPAADPAGLHPLLFRQPVVLITGPANAGKSTLLNAWCGHARALVADAPGTTRDLVAAEALTAGWRLRLLDSAGVRTTDDALERAGQELAAAARGNADLVLHLDPDGGARPAPGDLVVDGKADLRPGPLALPWSCHGAGGLTPATLLDQVASAALSRLGLPPAGLPAADPAYSPRPPQRASP